MDSSQPVESFVMQMKCVKTINVEFNKLLPVARSSICLTPVSPPFTLLPTLYVYYFWWCGALDSVIILLLEHNDGKF